MVQAGDVPPKARFPSERILCIERARETEAERETRPELCCVRKTAPGRRAVSRACRAHPLLHENIDSQGERRVGDLPLAPSPGERREREGVRDRENRALARGELPSLGSVEAERREGERERGVCVCVCVCWLVACRRSPNVML